MTKLVKKIWGWLLASVLVLLFPSGAWSQGQNFPSGAGGLNFVAALPGTCTPGVTASVQLSVAPYTINYCSAVNTWTALGNGSITGTGLQYGIAEWTTATNLGSTVPPGGSVGQFNCGYTILVALSPQYPTCPQVGLAGRAITGATATDTILFTDNNNVVRYEGSVAVAVTLPRPFNDLFNTKFFTILQNETTGASTAVTVTPTTLTINGNATLVINQGQQCSIYVDPAAPTTNWVSWCSDQSGYVNGLVLPLTVPNGGTGLATQTSNVIYKGNGTGVETVSSITDNGTTVTSTDTGGYVAPVFVSSGTTAGFVDFPQGTTSAAVAPCNTANSKCYQAPTALTANVETLAPATAQGILAVTGNAAATNEMYSGDTNHSITVTLAASQTVGATSLCSTTFCPVGEYMITVTVEITTACTTTGTLIPWVGWTDDAGAKGAVGTTFFGNGFGTGFVASTGTLTVTSTTDFMQGTYIVHSTGAAAINYGYTTSACGSGSLVGKLIYHVVPLG